MLLVAEASKSAWRRLLWLLVTACLMAAFSILVNVAPAAACSGTRLQGSPDPPADYVFTGTVVRLEDPADGMVISGGDMLEWTFVVDEVMAGDIGSRVTVRSARADGACGFVFELGARYLVKAVGGDAGPTVWLGSGTHEIAAVADPPPVEGTFKTLSATLLGVLPVAALIVVVSLAGFVVWRRVASMDAPGVEPRGPRHA